MDGTLLLIVVNQLLSADAAYLSRASRREDVCVREKKRERIEQLVTENISGGEESGPPNQKSSIPYRTVPHRTYVREGCGGGCVGGGRKKEIAQKVLVGFGEIGGFFPLPACPVCSARLPITALAMFVVGEGRW